MLEGIIGKILSILAQNWLILLPSTKVELSMAAEVGVTATMVALCKVETIDKL